MNKWLILGFFLIIGRANGQTPTVVLGAAERPDGKIDVMVLEQPKDAANPLGNPIYDANPQANQTSASQNQTPPDAEVNNDGNAVANTQNNPPSAFPYAITDDMPINPQFTPQTTPQIEAKKIQSTIYEDDGRIYDIQSVPVQDIDKVEEPNIQPTISTYPSY